MTSTVKLEKEVKKIALGTVQFGLDYGISNSEGKTSNIEIKKLLEFCKKNDIDTLDTAYAYGLSEQILGQNELSGFNIVSKYISGIQNESNIRYQLNDSLKKLRINTIYGYLAHKASSVSDHDWNEMREMKLSGYIKKIGFSFNEPHEVEWVLKKKYKPDLVQAPLNILDNRFSEKLKYLKLNYGTEIHVRSVFLQGLFFVPPEKLPNFFEPIKASLNTIYHTKNKSGMLIRYVTSKSFVDKVVLGVNNLNQLEENIRQMRQANIKIPALSNEILPECITPSMWPK